MAKTTGTVQARHALAAWPFHKAPSHWRATRTGGGNQVLPRNA